MPDPVTPTVTAPPANPSAPPVVAPAAPAPAAPAVVPDWLKDATPDEQKSFGQYATRADLLKAHNDLRTKLSAGKPADDGLAITPDAKPITDEDLQTFITSAGLNTSDIQKAWTEKGELTADQYKSLAGKGLGRKAVDTFLAMETKLRGYEAKEIKSQASQIVGGAQQLDALLNWARQEGSLTQQERDWYAAQVNDPASAVRAVEWLNGKYTAAVGAGKASPLIEGGGVAVGATAFTSRVELAEAMNHPDYRPGTPHYLRVQARINATQSITGLPA